MTTLTRKTSPWSRLNSLLPIVKRSDQTSPWQESNPHPAALLSSILVHTPRWQLIKWYDRGGSFVFDWIMNWLVPFIDRNGGFFVWDIDTYLSLAGLQVINSRLLYVPWRDNCTPQILNSQVSLAENSFYMLLDAVVKKIRESEDIIQAWLKTVTNW